MNMAINSMPVASAKTSSAGGTASTASSATGNAFAGALVQAIDGKGNQAPTNGTLPLPVGLAGLFSQVGGEEGTLSAEQLLEALAKLADQLQQLEQDGADKLPDDAQAQLASLLATLQNLLGQTNPQPVDSPSGEAAIATSVTATLPQETKPTPGKLVASLREALQALSDSIASGAEIPPQTNGFVGKLQQALDTIVAPATAQAANANAPVKRGSDKEQADKGATQQTSGQETAGSSTTANADQRRPILALREPVWRFNVNDADQQKNAESGEASVVATVSESEASATSDTQPAWALLRNDALAGADATQKAAMPASVPVQQFAEQMEKFLVKQFQLTQGNGTSEAKLSLTPEHLGQVDIRIVMHNGQVTAQFMTESAMAKDMLENQMSQLKASLSGQGLNVERLEVVQQSSSSTGASFMQQQQRQSNSGNGNGSNRSGSGDSAEDQAVFAAEMERTSFMREFGQGGSINVTA
ncbi:flagellar hook-length control protein FliK [Cohnella suwonensis]|uniref:Flagellar hook-length control protein FliK n=1 Tax=Cohnella suwonensis TaxID=696072 RepID=A0ABW0M1J5_9BACL